jgi:murein DD-endopeptidase MepM/ murein hydrolase activator NlpD
MNVTCVLITVLVSAFFVGCSDPSDTEVPKPFVTIPLDKDTPQLTISQGWFYGPPEDSVHPGILTHFAVDFPAKWGTPIYSPANGVAVASYHTYDMIDAQGRTIGYGLGLFIQMWHEQAKVYTSYAHLSGINNELIPYIAPTLENGSWQPRNAIYMPIADFRKIAKPVKKGDLIGYIGYTGLRLGYAETPANPPMVDPAKDKTWDPAGAHLHWEVYTRTPDGLKKDKRYDPFGIYGTQEKYGDVFTKAMGLILANPDGSPQFAR